ncbi:MAG: hypothetical protein ACRCZB_05425 [Bacteroidales bacterium]
MSEAFNGFTVNVTIEGGSDSIPQKSLGFTLHDSIFSSFPDMTLVFPDVSGIALEYGSFMQGIRLNTTLGVDSDLLETSWKIISREAIKEGSNSPRLSGILKVQAIHESFFKNRTNPKLSFKKKLVSDCVTELFPDEASLNVETTVGNIETYAFDEPYTFVRDVLLSSANNGKIRPFVFFRDLNQTLNFCSIDSLLSSSSVASFELKSVLDDQTEIGNIIQGFLPFNEQANLVYPKMRVSNTFITSDLELKTNESSIATDEKDTIPLLSSGVLENDIYMGREFNPDVDYEDLNKGFEASSMSYILEKALCVIPYNYNCIAGKVVELKINVSNPEGDEQLSEFYSGKWLIEQSYHCWEGETMRPYIKMVLCRTGVKPINNSKLVTDAFKD